MAPSEIEGNYWAGEVRRRLANCCNIIVPFRVEFRGTANLIYVLVESGRLNDADWNTMYAAFCKTKAELERVCPFSISIAYDGTKW